MPRATVSLSLLCMRALAACSGRGRPGEPELKDGDLVKVREVVKGDEVTVVKDGRDSRVRLVGVHAFSPVLADPQVHALSAGAVTALEDWVLGKEVRVRLDHTPRDANGRWLGYLEDCDAICVREGKTGADINMRLVETGWAVVYTEFPFDREKAYLAAESAARSAGRNVWALKPAADLVRGLRRQWLTVRHGDGKTALADALLQ